ncbi:sigma factor-like helix-turn-helix DNA-binding protein [Priestia megaterium]|uniref:sigma factor-like helix-turn-helix DNA-binding protein n=1 Tax=Priestia megaterium TaxID=1404 RepID=UPI003D298B9E
MTHRTSVSVNKWIEIIKEIEKNEVVFRENDILRTFIKDKNNIIIFQKAKEYPSYKNLLELDLAFQEHYFKIRFLNYVSTSLHFRATDYDKMSRKRKKTIVLTIDKSMSNESGSNETFKDLIQDENLVDTVEEIISTFNSLEENISDPKLKRAMETLNDNQKLILKKCFVDQLSDTEVGRQMNKTQQAISKTKNAALKKLKFFMQQGEI